MAGCTYPPLTGAEGAGFGLEAQEARAAAARARTMSFMVFGVRVVQQNAAQVKITHHDNGLTAPYPIPSVMQSEMLNVC